MKGEDNVFIRSSSLYDICLYVLCKAKKSWIHRRKVLYSLALARAQSPIGGKAVKNVQIDPQITEIWFTKLNISVVVSL